MSPNNAFLLPLSATRCQGFTARLHPIALASLLLLACGSSEENTTSPTPTQGTSSPTLTATAPGSPTATETGSTATAPTSPTMTAPVAPTPSAQGGSGGQDLVQGGANTGGTPPTMNAGSGGTAPGEPPPTCMGSPTTDRQLQGLKNKPALIELNTAGNGATSLTGVTQPQNGRVNIVEGSAQYVPAADYAGTDSFNYCLSDGTVGSVTLDVRPFPNFLFILTDDQGWTSLSTQMDTRQPASKSDYHLTPHIDRLAEQGMRFSRGYSPAPNCSPTRYANLTGKTTTRLGFTDITGRNADPLPDTPQLLISPGKKVRFIQDEEVTIPELLKTLPRAGYVAAHYGKWHLSGGGPMAQGFDAGDGLTSNAEGNQGPASTAVDDPKLAYSMTNRALKWLGDQQGKPFFLQISHYAVHQEVQYSKKAFDRYQGIAAGQHHSDRAYAAMTTDMDEAVGQAVAAIDKLGLRHSTYVIYQADNGAPKHLSDNTPLRGAKPEVWEGGLRVPTIIRGPGISAGSQFDQPIMGIDLLPSIWEWAGGQANALPDDLDGGSLVTAIDAVSGGRTPPPVERSGEMMAYTPHYVLSDGKDQRPRAVLYDGRYKLMVHFETGSIELYDVENQVEENADLAKQEPDVHRRMWIRLRDYMKEVDALYALPDPDNFGTGGKLGDADGDGLEDAWEARELLSYAFDGNSDPDGDGKTNQAEATAGTDPLIP